MPRRYDMRIPTVMEVKVRGVDTQGNRFEQVARTINVSRTGARLEGVAFVQGAQSVELRRGWFRKARFRVIWTGRPTGSQADHVGLRLLEKDASFWGIPFPAPQWQPDFVPPSAPPPFAQASPLAGKWDAPPREAAPPPLVNARAMGYSSDSEVVPLTWEKSLSSAAAASRTIRERVAAVTVRFTTHAGEVREETCVAARVLRDKSCIVPMRVALMERTEVTLVNTRSNAARPAIVSMCGPQMPDGTYPIAMDLASPDPQFWASSGRASDIVH